MVMMVLKFTIICTFDYYFFTFTIKAGQPEIVISISIVTTIFTDLDQKDPVTLYECYPRSW